MVRPQRRARNAQHRKPVAKAATSAVAVVTAMAAATIAIVTALKKVVQVLKTVCSILKLRLCQRTMLTVTSMPPQRSQAASPVMTSANLANAAVATVMAVTAANVAKARHKVSATKAVSKVPNQLHQRPISSQTSLQPPKNRLSLLLNL